MELAHALPILLGLAWLLPLASFAVIVAFGPWMGKAGRGAAYVATAAILAGFVLSLAALGCWLSYHPLTAGGHDAAAGHSVSAEGEQSSESEKVQVHTAPARAVSGEWYALAEFAHARVAVGYYIDGLTIAMFCMVTLIASCIHVYSTGYMHDELYEVADPQVTCEDGSVFRRPGRYHRFFQYLSLFCFSMLGLVIAGNVAMVFMFWELVGVCSYFLIGFYFERQTASNAANKAFIVNRVGDFGMIIGLMALWGSLGTFAFGDAVDADGHVVAHGIFSQVRPTPEAHNPIAADGMVRDAARERVAEIVRKAPSLEAAAEEISQRTGLWREQGFGYWLLVVAGLGIFCGCVGKSAQFPLHVWLPDAMEGPTPVSALIHAATMVAAGVYLVGRFYPVFAPEVLLTIAVIGTITLFIAATIALTATDIKRVLAYSTVSQLGYMMLALGAGGWVAGLFHLFTHAFFKALLFLGSGSVIHACGTNEMPQMGGLRHKMPWTAYTMLVGCLAIAGAGVPFLIGLSGYYSKDAIIAQLFVFQSINPAYSWMFYAAAGGAALTAFYMFRLWYLTFAGEPRDKHVAEHVHESPRVMVAPLVVLAFFAIAAGWSVPWLNVGFQPLLEQARPLGTAEGLDAGRLLGVKVPAEHESHAPAVHAIATLVAFSVALAGFLLATVFYGLRKLDPADVRRQFAPIYHFLVHKWWFDELYRAIFVRPVMWISQCVAAIDKRGIDWLADNLARLTALVAKLDDLIDRYFVDAVVNRVAEWTYRIGVRLRAVQTGNVRQYVMLLAVGTVVLFVLLSFYWNQAAAGQ